MKLIKPVVIVAALGLLSACVHPQKEDVHGSVLESTALGLNGTAAPHAPKLWWHEFGDPQLDRLVDDALLHNPMLDEALARVRATSAQTIAAGAALQPGVSFDSEETYQRFSENFYIPPPFAGNRYWAGTTGANLSWTLDFWGKQAALIRQAKSLGVAAELNRWSARLALSGSLAQAYLDLYRAYAVSDIAARALQQRTQLLDLAQQRYGAGIDTSIELKVAEARIADARSAVEQASSARDLAVHRLASLAGHGADFYAKIERPQLVLDAALPIPDSLPINLLSRRPDVLAARARVDAADAGRAAAKAAFYPDLSLKAFTGIQAIGLENILQGGSVIYGAGPALHLPIFDSRRLKAAYRGSTAELDAAIASYNDVVLNAVRQTADQLSLVSSFATQRSLIQQRLTAAEAAYDFAQQRYSAGLSTQLVVLNAESEVLGAQRDLVALESNRAVARVTLLLTLGGSFEPGESNE